MTIASDTTFWLHGPNYTGQQLREFISWTGSNTTGVLGDNLEVTPQSPASLNLEVSAGAALIPSAVQNRRDNYLVIFPAGQVRIEAAHPTENRTDLVVARVYDSTTGTGSPGQNEAQVEVVRGSPTPAGSTPPDPQVPDSSVVLASVLVSANVLSITSANITDRRTQAELPVTGPGGFVDTPQLADDAVTQDKLGDGAVGTAQIQNGAVTASKYAALSVSASALADRAVATRSLQDEAVTGAKIDDNTIVNSKIQNGTIEGDKIASNTITNGNISPGTITGDKLVDLTLLEDNFGDDEVTGRKIADAVYRSFQLVGGTYVRQDGNAATTHRAVYVGSSQPPGSNYQVGDIWLEI